MKSTPIERGIQPASQTVPAVSGTENEDWFRLPPVGGRCMGLSRSTWNELDEAGLIKSITLKKPGRQRGIKLLYKPSVKAYFDSLLTAAEGSVE